MKLKTLHLLSLATLLGGIGLISNGCKKNVSNAPEPGGKPSIAVKVTTGDDQLFAGGDAIFDLTLTSTSDLKKLVVEESVQNPAGGNFPSKIIKDSSFPSGSFLPQFNLIYNIPDSLHAGQKVDVKFTLTNANGTATITQTLNVKDANIGLTVNQDKTGASPGQEIKFSLDGGSTVPITRLVIKEKQGANTVVLTDSALTLPKDVHLIYNYYRKISGTKGENRIMTFTIQNKNGGTASQNASYDIK